MQYLYKNFYSKSNLINKNAVYKRYHIERFKLLTNYKMSNKKYNKINTFCGNFDIVRMIIIWRELS